jgi:DNA-directed RNA polymerase specialized sigma24 family protein
MNLTEIAQHHDEWVRIVKRFGAKTEAEDIVQDMYIRFHKYGKGQVITKSFIWIMLRNIFFDYCKREISMVDIDLIVDLSEDENNKTYEIELYYQSVEEQIKTWEWFDQQLFLLYLRSGKSMRELEKETKISLTSIFHTIKKCKIKLKIWQKEYQKDLVIQ